MPLTLQEFDRKIKWLHNRAEEVRTSAEDMRNPESRRTILLLAASYEVMASHLETACKHLSLKRTG